MVNKRNIEHSLAVAYSSDMFILIMHVNKEIREATKNGTSGRQSS